MLGVLGYIGSFMTAVYTFRMIFRAFYGDPLPEARELEHGHLAHDDEPTNPATGEEEDTDVGFPGPDHHIAERERPMKVAMGGARRRRDRSAASLQIPGVTDVVHNFLEPTFEDSRFYTVARADATPSLASAWSSAPCSALAGIGARLPAVGAGPERRHGSARASPACTASSSQVVLRRADRHARSSGRSPGSAGSRATRSSASIVNGLLVGGTAGVVRAGSAAVRAIQSGFLRAYAALLLLGLAGLGLYFLISAS